jgi:methionyl-tRNA synthetase
VIGKDITRFHCVIWPAMLHAAGEAVPERVWAHGFISFGGDRFSKSAGVTLELGEAVSRYGPDALRYFLLREVGFASDGEFSWERFDARYVSDLADGLGNLASRSLAMVEKYCDGAVPVAEAETTLDADGVKALDEYTAAMDAFDLRGGAEAAGRLVGQANQYIVATAPWALAKKGEKAALDQVLASLVRCLSRLALMYWPFMPGKSAELWTALGWPEPIGVGGLSSGKVPRVAGLEARKTPGLFPKPSIPNS